MALFFTAHYRRLKYLSPPFELIPKYKARYIMLFIYPNRCLSSTSESTHPEFSIIENAYEVLGVSEDSSFDEIKVSFRKLAKETHPDLVSSTNSDSKRFVEILSAYEILSDPNKRSLYDQYLLTTRNIVVKNSREGSTYHMYVTNTSTPKQMEVVEWLRWYRYAVKDILSERSLPAGTGYFDVLQRELYSAIHSAYFGPEIQSLELLPDCFEAEERSVCETPEVLHLVSGRDLFGIVRISDDLLELPDVSYEKLASSHLDLDFSDRKTSKLSRKNVKFGKDSRYGILDSYKDLELYVCGRLVAMATRVPPKEISDKIEEEFSQDKIHVFLNSYRESVFFNPSNSKKSMLNGSVSKILLGTISGLGTNPDESSCDVYNSNGSKTHVILKHRTPLVKHLHWFQLADQVSICECRCTRARLPPSKFWLFEPRCSTHDIGGWYVETYGRDRKSQNVPSQRYWDGFNVQQEFDKRLHPAVYLLTLAYRTLDIEEAKKSKRTFWNIAQGKLFKMFQWCKSTV